MSSSDGLVYVPARDFMNVADVIARVIVVHRLSIDDLTVAVRDGELWLSDQTSSYGVRRFDS